MTGKRLSKIQKNNINSTLPAYNKILSYATHSKRVDINVRSAIESAWRRT